MRVALAQINPTVGDIAGNSRKILDFVERAKSESAQLVVFPELALIGYPPRDLLLKPQFIDDNIRAVQLIASHVSGIDAVIGYADRNAQPVGRPLHNAVALVRDGAIVSRHFKTLLPTYDVFDESRYFEPGHADERANIANIGGHPVGFSICEDLWNDERMIARRLYHQNPIAALRSAGAEILVNTSASPFVAGKQAFRIELFASQVRQVARPLVYVNQVGGNDELVFDGNSLVFDAAGNVVAQAAAFEEDLLLVDLTSVVHPVSSNPKSQNHESPSDACESIYRALVLGLRDYVHKCGFKSVVLGLSGGIDSALTAAIACAAFGPDHVVGIAMPSRFSSDHSVNDAKLLAENLGIAFHTIPIKTIHDAYEQLLVPAFGDRPRDITEENLQARARGAILMAFSNKFNHLLLTTGNKSELAVGYCTLYGDMCGGLAVISDVPKTIVYALAEYINAKAGRDLIPRSSITKPPSAELRPNQTDQDSLPPYEVLDAILHKYVEEEKGAAQIIAEGFDAAVVMRIITLIDRSEYKRRQAAPGLKVTSRAFGSGRRMPIAQSYHQSMPGARSTSVRSLLSSTNPKDRMSQIKDEHNIAAAMEHHRAGRRQDAETIYRQILSRDPQHPDALHLLGVLAHQAGRNDLACELIRQSLALQPNCVDAYSNLGLVLKAQEKPGDAIVCYRHALNLAPDYPELHYNLAALLRATGKLDEAIASYQRALSLRPDYSDALNNLAIILLQTGRGDEAIECCRRAIATDTEHAAAHNNLGNALKHLGRLDEAIDAYQRAVELQPQHPTAQNNLGVALKDAGQLRAAISCFQAALSLDPGVAETHNNLALVLQTCGQLDDALACLERALKIRPDYPEALNNLGLLYKDMARLDDATRGFHRALAIKPPRADIHSNLIYTLLFQPDRQQQGAHELQRWNLLHARPSRSQILPHDNDADPDRRLKIGYVSPDFRNHCAASFLFPLLRAHDHSAFEIHCFASVLCPDEMTAEFAALADRWHSVAALTDAALAKLVRDQHIDILVDLTLHMANNRLLAFARKPAPVQVTWLGYPGSTGLEAIDYRISDPHLDPPREHGYIEKTYRLPETFWCYDPLCSQPAVNALPAAETGCITFGCLNNFCKSNAGQLQLWASTMRQVKLLALILLAPNGSARAWVQQIFESEGIEAVRIQFEPSRSRADYLRLYHQIDIALDSFPYNGHTTSLDALWMGVPVVTLAGRTPVSRAGLCQLTNLGLPNLVAESPRQFVQIALQLAGDLPELARLRATLRSRMEASPLMDARRFARNLESAYRTMWKKNCHR